MALTYPTMIEGQWNLIATGITSGSIDRLSTKYAYYETHVETTTTAPSESVKDKSPTLFEDSSNEIISSSYAMDLYIYPERITNSGETITNSLRLDTH